MTSLRSPGLSSQSVSGCSGQKRPKKPETDWDDNPGKPRLVIPVDFGVFWPKGAKKPRNGLGSPGFSSQSVSGFSGQKEPKKPETDWDDKSGKPRLVIPVRFRVSRPKRTTKTRNGLGRRAWEAQVCPFRGFLAKKGQKNPKQTGMTSLGSPGLSSQSVSGFSGQKGHNKTRNGLGSSQSVSAKKGQKTPETDWDDDKPGLPRLVVRLRFGV